MFPDKLRVSSFPNRLPHYACTAAESAHSDFVGSRVYECLGVTCHLHFWQNDRGLLHATAVTRGWVEWGGGGGGTDTEFKSAHKVNSGEENSAAVPGGIRTCNLSRQKR